MRDTKCEIRAVFLGPLKRGRGGDRGEEHDGVDGDLKGNERGMMQAWVRIAAKAGDGLCPTDRGKKE